MNVVEKCYRALVAGAVLLGVMLPAQGAEYPMPRPGNDLVGEVYVVAVQEGETLLDIARDHDLGYNEIIAANPGVDPWLPEPGTRITIPARYVLPAGPRSGIVVNLAEMRLYYYPPAQPGEGAKVMTFPIGIGQEGWATPVGKARILVKDKDPVWTVPESILAASIAEGYPLPRVVPPGPDNPLGKYALRLDMVGYLIHGTNKPYGVGRRISHGCIRMYPEDIETLFGAVEVGARVEIINQPYKLGLEGNALYLESHEPVFDRGEPAPSNLPQVIRTLSVITRAARREVVKEQAVLEASRHDGIPHHIKDVRVDAADERSGAGWMLQVGAFTNAENARQVAYSLDWVDVPIAIKTGLDDGYCRVLIGPFAAEWQAQDALWRIVRAGGVKGYVFPASRHGPQMHCVS